MSIRHTKFDRVVMLSARPNVQSTKNLQNVGMEKNRRILLFLIILLFTPTNSPEKLKAISSRTKEVVQAMSGVITNFYEKNSQEFDIFCCSSQRGFFDDAILFIKRKHRDMFSRAFEKSQNDKISLKTSAIMFFNSFKLFRKFMRNKISLDNLTSRLLFILVFDDRTE